MKRTSLICIITLLSLFQMVNGQENQLRISGHFEELGFAEFAEAIKAQTGVTFYYRESWVQDISVTLSGSALSLLTLLDSILLPEGLYYFLDEWNHLFLSDTGSLICGLPEYASASDLQNSGIPELENTTLTSAEQKYIYGRRVLEPEIIHVGSSSLFSEGKRVLINGRINDQESGEPLIGATLYIEEINKGTSSNSDGLFNLIVQSGTYDVECNSMGMESLHFTLVVYSDGDMALTEIRFPARAKGFVPTNTFLRRTRLLFKHG